MALPTIKLIEEARQLSQPDLEEVIRQLLLLQAERIAPSLSAEEADLFMTINASLTADEQARFDKLVAKRRGFDLDGAEHAELVVLIDKVEKMDARRAQALGRLAQLRGMPLEALMSALGIKTPSVT